MRITLLPIWGLLLLLGLFQDSQQAVSYGSIPMYSGSGDIVLPGSGDDDDDDDNSVVLPVASSGAGPLPSKVESTTRPIPKITTPYPTINIDDEDSSTVVYSGSGMGSTTAVLKPATLEGSGSGHIRSEHMKCSPTYLYCWCEDRQGREIPHTRMYVADAIFKHDCDDVVDVIAPVPNKFTFRPPPSTKVVTEPEPTTKKSLLSSRPSSTELVTKKKPTTPSTLPTEPTTRRSPYVVGTDKGQIKIGNEKTPVVKVVTSEKPVEEGVDHDGIFGEREDNYGVVKKEHFIPVFAHPGILAAVIGGGVVALLCALLLVMFIVYRMKKKDEGSYSVDGNMKPRLHTYTRAPSKEFA